MSVASEIERIKGNIASAYTAASGKGATLPDVQNSANLAGCIDTITGGGEPVDKSKYGVTIDAFLGDVDADGFYSPSTESCVINLNGIKEIASYGFSYRFVDMKISEIISDATLIGDRAFKYAFSVSLTDYGDVKASFDSVSEITTTPDGATTNRTYGNNAFERAFSSRQGALDVSFKNLRKVDASNAFAYFAPNTTFDIASAFPALEEVSGSLAFENFVSFNQTTVVEFPAVKKITGWTSKYNSTFGGFYVKDTVWKFPSATEFTGYIWNVSTSYPGEIHFAAANQAAIEACDGYANKWGFAGATIFFDL